MRLLVKKVSMLFKKSNVFQFWPKLWPHLSASRRIQFFLLFAVVVISSIFEVINIGAIMPFLGVLSDPDGAMKMWNSSVLSNFLDISSPTELILFFSLSFCAINLLVGVFRFLLLYCQIRFSYGLMADFGIEIYKRTLHQEYLVHISRNSSQIISGISGKSGALVGNGVLPSLVLMSSAIMVCIIFVALLVVNPFVALGAVMGFSAIYFSILFFTKDIIKVYSSTISRSSTEVIRLLQEGLGGIRDILIDNTQGTYLSIYKKVAKQLYFAQSSVQIYGGAPKFFIESISLALIALFAAFLALDGSRFVEAIPILGALALGAQRLLPLVQQAYASLSTIRGGQSSIDDALMLLNQPMLDNLGENIEPITFNKSIIVSDLSFEYVSKIPVLRDVTFSIERGAKIGIVGTTGSGKSTLMDVLMGLLHPTAGEILIDGVSLNRDNILGWQKNIAHVPQSIFLTDSSIAENIAFGVNPCDIDYKLVAAVSKTSQLDALIDSWPDKYMTLVGERGVRLSGGQRQRIGIARALYKKAKFIIFDEATSALDGKTEIAVMDAINSLEKDLTILIVAHRLSTLKNCDLIIKIENGQIVETGSYEKVVNLK